MDDDSFRIEVNERVHLSPLRPEDKPAVAAFLHDRDFYDHTLRIPHPYTEADFDGFLAIAENEAAERGHPVHFAVRDRDERAIGGCGLEGLSYNHRAELGYWLAKSYWGQGVMTDVVRSACDFAIDRWKLVRIVAHVFDFNIASARVLEKNGFQLEGVLRKHNIKDGKYIDSRLYALVR